MSDYIGANSFMQGFMQGYSFIDDMQARKRAEARLEQRLQEEREQRQWLRTRTGRLDREAQIDRDRRRSTEDQILQRQEDIDAANRALAGVKPGDYEGGIMALGPWAHLPSVSQKIAELRDAAQRQQDDLRLARGEGGATGGLVDGAAGVAAGANGAAGVAAGANGAAGVADPRTQGVAAAVTPYDGETIYPDAGLPPQGGVQQEQQRLSTAELEAMAIADPAKAAAARDQQRALDAPQMQDIGDPMAGGPVGVQTASTTTRAKRVQSAKDKRDLIRSGWSANLDINNPNGDPFRSLPPKTQIGQYYQDRSALSPEQQAEGDRLMAPHLQSVIAEQQEILANEQIDPNSMEGRAAKRKLNEAYALINARAGFKPNEAAGVNDSGLPVNGRNQPLVDQVIARSLEQPAPQAPGTPTQVAAEDRILERGAKNGRVSSAFTQAAWRKYARGEIDYKTYTHLVNTGQYPSGVTTTLEQFDPKKGPVWAVSKDDQGNLHLRKIIEGSMDADEMAQRYRNLIEGPAGEQVQRWAQDLAEQLGTGKNGATYAMEFASMLGQNETEARARGYDYGNLADISMIWERWKDLNVISEAIDGELFYKGHWNTDFQKAFGMTIAEALFSDIGERDLAELEDPTKSNIFGRGPSPDLLGIKPRQTQGLYDAIRRQFGEDLTDEQITQILNSGG